MMMLAIAGRSLWHKHLHTTTLLTIPVATGPIAHAILWEPFVWLLPVLLELEVMTGIRGHHLLGVIHLFLFLLCFCLSFLSFLFLFQSHYILDLVLLICPCGLDQMV